MGCGGKCQIMSILIGILLIVAGCLLRAHWESLLRSQMKRMFTISKTSRTYESWMKTKSPGTTKFYFFNWTNSDDMEEPGYKPNLVEVGPYVFAETIEKVDVAFHKNGTASYRMKRHWYFDRNRSIGPLSDRIVSANPVAASVKFSSRFSFSLSTITRLAAPLAFNLKTVKTVDELLFKGYEDNLINLGRFSQVFFSDIRDIPYDRFGWWYPRNGSHSEVFNVETGENGMDKFGELKNWDHKLNTGAYNGSCGDVYGSGGNFWAWNLTKNENVFLFSGDICRSINMTFGEEISYGGLPAFRYESGPDLVDNGTLDDRNRCLCNGECVPVGVFNASACSKGAPVFISYPHFQYGDPYYTDSVDGMAPEKNKHIILLVLEPNYGIPLELSARIQINILIESQFNQRSWDDDSPKRIFFPVLWVDQNFKIRPEDLRTLKLLAFLPQLGFIGFMIFVSVGAAIIVGCLACRYFRNRRKVPFREIRTIQVNGGQVTEPNDKQNIKFNYLKDSNL